MEALIYLLKSAAILAIFYSIYRIFLEKETFFSTNRHFLIAGILCAATFPVLTFTQLVYIDPLPIDSLQIDESMLVIKSSEGAAASINWWQWGFYIYFTGFLIMSVRFLMQLASMFKFLVGKPGKKIAGFRFIENNDLDAPFSFFNYIIYNPQNHSADELEMILAHEKTHARQLHTLDILLAQVLLIVQWFNPIAWFYKKKIEQNLEFLADKEALSEITNRKTYQLTLLKVSFAGQTPALANNFYQSFIKKRIVMLNKNESHRSNKLKIAVVLPLIALFLWSFNVKQEVRIKESKSTSGKPAANPEQNNAQRSTSAQEVKEVIQQDTLTGNYRVLDSLGNASKGYKMVKDTLVNLPALKTSSIKINDPFRVTINQTMSKDEVDDVVDRLKADYDVVLRVSNLKYNSDNIISGITLKIKDNQTGNTGNFNLKKESTKSNEEGVGIIVIERTKSGGLSFGSGKTMTEYLDKTRNLYGSGTRFHVQRDSLHALNQERQLEVEKRRIKKEKRRIEGEGRIVKRQEELNQRVVEREKRRVEQLTEEQQEEQNIRALAYEERKNDRIDERKARQEEMKARVEEMKEREKKMEYVVVSEDELNKIGPIKLKDDVLYIVDGKEIDLEEANKIDPLDILSVSVLKGEEQTKEYKDKMEGKRGVVLITTKEK